jgi:hypothetical protein
MRKISFILVAMLCFTGMAFSQETTGNVEGMVRDQSGAIVPGVAVTISGVNTAYNRTITAGSDGAYLFVQVPVGVYKVKTGSASGFAASSSEEITVVLGKTTVVNFALQPASATADVTVTTDTTTIDPTDTKIQTNITSRTVELLPKGTNFTSLLKVSPATRAEPLSGQFQVDGASGSENTFVIDGQEVSNFRTGVLNANNNLPFQFVQEVQIKTSGFEAEFGGASGGVINVATKSGNNDFHGEFGVQFQPSRLQAGPRAFQNRFTTGTGTSNVQIIESLRPQRDSFSQFFPTANLSGPVIKNRFWFFGSYTPQIFDTSRTSRYFTADPRTRTLTATERYQVKQRNHYAFGRLDAQLANNLRVNGAYTWNPIEVDGNLPDGNISIGGAPPSVNFGAEGFRTGRAFTDGQGGRQNANNLTGSVNWTPTSKTVVNFRAGRSFLNEKLASYGNPSGLSFAGAPTTLARTRCRIIDPTLCPVGQNFPFLQNLSKDASLRKSFDVDVSQLVSNFAGRHNFKFGYQYSTLFNDVDNRFVDRVDLFYGFGINDLSPVELTPTPNAIGAGFLLRFATRGEARNKRQSFFAQDSWQPTEWLSVTAGIRAEKENLPAFNEFAPPINFNFGDKLAPRLGIAIDPFKDGKTKIFASYGRFYDALKFELPRGSFGGDFFRVDYFEILPGQAFNTFFTAPRILGSNQDVRGGRCPIPNSTGLSRCQADFRIASNDPAGDIFTGRVDPDLEPFRQTEFTVGVERDFGAAYKLSARYTYKNVDSAIEDAGFPTADGSEAYIIGNPGRGLHAATARQFGYIKVAEPQRRYDAFELKLDRRLGRFSDNSNFSYYYQANYTYSRLYGNYSGLASSDEGGRTSPGVNRFFDLPFIGFTADGRPDNGRLATDRPHVFNAYGAVTYDWLGKKNNSTELSFFTTAQSGTPQTTFFTFYGAATILNGRGDLGRTPTLTQSDLALTHRYKFGSDNRFTMAFDFNLINAFNEANVLTLNQTINAPGFSVTGATIGVAGDEAAVINVLLSSGIRNQLNSFFSNPANAHRTDRGRGLPTGYQGGRQVRFGFRLLF